MSNIFPSRENLIKICLITFRVLILTHKKEMETGSEQQKNLWQPSASTLIKISKMFFSKISKMKQ